MITPLGIKSALKEAKDTKSDIYISDDTGQRLGWRLQLRCLPSGSATWIFRYTHDRKRKQINLGNLNTLGISSAREAALGYAAIYKVTPDVIGKLQADKNDASTSEAELIAKKTSEAAILKQKEYYTLSELMKVYVNYLDKMDKKTTARDVVSLSKHLHPIGSKPAGEITASDLVTVQRTLLDEGKGRTANKLRSFVRAAYGMVLRANADATSPAAALDFATLGNVGSNPAASVFVAKGFSGTRGRALEAEELCQLLDRAKMAGAIGLSVRAAFLLGGQRFEQLLRVTVNDVSEGFIELLDPKGRRDEPRRHPIPLEGDAGLVIAEAVTRAEYLKTKWLFSSTGKIKLHRDTVAAWISKMSVEFVNSGISKSPFTLGDLRRTAESKMGSLNVSKDHRAQLQSHGLGGVQSKHYDRHDYEMEKREALRRLHKYVQNRGNNPVS